MGKLVPRIMVDEEVCKQYFTQEEMDQTLYSLLEKGFLKRQVINGEEYFSLSEKGVFYLEERDTISVC